MDVKRALKEILHKMGHLCDMNGGGLPYLKRSSATPCSVQAVSPPKSKHGKQKSDFLARLAVSQSFLSNQVTQKLRFWRFSLCNLDILWMMCAYFFHLNFFS